MSGYAGKAANNGGCCDKIIMDHCKVSYGAELQNLGTYKRNAYIRELRDRYGLSIRQIEIQEGIYT
ncbi:hypothetical protein Gferi_13855 [Geosporobacter ferrireducens]|uniref:Uncharacterized protein n=1 Tax=Geosporobacter ferrireducens TaxID=1424294 RepID=A0A1D8GI14_9FIRM|nr:hypothetical protein Gferi_13855 [Geosporobacter ferrireducens]